MRIRYLLMNAYGVGGTIRTVINQANAMAAEHDVEIISVFRRREHPAFAIDPAIRLTPLVDERCGHRPDLGPAWRHPVRHWQARRPAAYIPPDETRASIFTRPVERAITDHLRTVHDGVLVATRPALNLLTARFADPQVVRIAQEHINLRSYKPGVRADIARWYPRLDAVTVLTHADERDYLDAFGGAASDPGVRIEQIPNPLPAADVPPPLAPTRSREPIVIAAGRLVRAKGYDRLIDAFARIADDHPEWELRIYGDGKWEDRLRRQIDDQRMDGRVRLMGNTRHVEKEMAKASVFALSSRFEGFPMVLLEAMRQGLPIAAFDCHTGPAELITHDQNGLLVPQDDIAALAKTLNDLITDEARRQRLGDQAAQAVAPYAMERILPRWEQLFNELLDARDGRLRNNSEVH